MDSTITTNRAATDAAFKAARESILKERDAMKRQKASSAQERVLQQIRDTSGYEVEDVAFDDRGSMRLAVFDDRIGRHLVWRFDYRGEAIS